MENRRTKFIIILKIDKLCTTSEFAMVRHPEPESTGETKGLAALEGKTGLDFIASQ